VAPLVAEAPEVAPAPPRAEEPAPAPVGPCPRDMVYVDATHCPRASHRCLLEEYSAPNNIVICHRFAPGQRCAGGERRERFCIDRYEFPNEAGAHPPVMVDAYDAAAACDARGKRLCWESEWVAACEGPDKLPFPYGPSRDPSKCNIDNPYLHPALDRIYSSDPEVASRELARLDQSAPSGARAGCVSGYGVHDLTGNVDEWVLSEAPRGRSKWAALKGGAWGHVRNACRPVTTSHAPEFTYYFVSFRCCADPTGGRAEGDWAPPPRPRARDPKGSPRAGWTPGRGPSSTDSTAPASPEPSKALSR
jgi:hypothetical protein